MRAAGLNPEITLPRIAFVLVALALPLLLPSYWVFLLTSVLIAATLADDEGFLRASYLG